MSQFPPPIYHHKPSGRDRARVNGRDIWLGAHGSREARAAYARLVAELSAGLVHRVDDLTINAAIALWWQGPGAKQSVSEADNYRHSLKPLCGLFGVDRAVDFGPKKLATVVEAMIGAKLSRGVINRRIVRIRTVWRWIERQELVPRGSWESLRTVRVDPGRRDVTRHPKRKAVDWSTVEAILPKLPPVVRGMVLFQWWTGCRPGEVRTMLNREVDAAAWVYRPAHHKMEHVDQERVVMVGPEARAVLSAWLRPGDPDGLVFPSPAGGYSDVTYPRAIARACKAAGVTLFCPYQLRHAAKRRFTQALGLDAARAALGQLSIGTTALYDHHQDLELARKAAMLAG